MLLQYYAALAELEQEGKSAGPELKVAAARAAAGEPLEQVRQPMLVGKQVRVAL